MIQRFVKDESGITMALTVIVMVLIGVMAAGLLAFVRSDLDAMLEINRGQKALHIADAGVQAAKSHLRVDSFRQHYDTNRANDCNEGIRVGGENWSKAADIYNVSTNGYCTPGQEATRTDNAGTPWREDQGVTKTFAGGRFHVTIECYDQSGDGSPDPCNGGAGAAPDAAGANLPASSMKFFKITSTGYDTVAGNGAIRKVEAIYTTVKNTYAPVAFWTPKSIDFNGNTTVRKMSFFAGINITSLQNVTPMTDSPAIYEDWYAPPYNTTRRVNASGNPIVTPGFAAVQLACSRGPSQCIGDSDSITDAATAGYRDYDRTTGNKGQRKKFVATVTDPGNQITFPFQEGNALADPSSLVDPGLAEEMRLAAAEQNNYKTSTDAICNNNTCTISSWPAQGSIYFVDAGGKDVSFAVATSPKPKGVLIVRNGNFRFANTGGGNAGFEGVVIVIGNGTTTGTYTQTGQVSLDGYVAASGDMKLAGNVAPNTSVDYTNLNSFYDVQLWSWREVYQ